MTRINKQSTVSTLIKEIQTALSTMKRTQYVGASSIHLETGVTGFGTMTIPAGQDSSYDLEFVADKQDNAFVQISYEVYDGGTNESQKDHEAFADLYKKTSSDPKRSVWKWVFTNRHSTTRTFYIRFYYQATDSGVLSAS